MTRAIPKLQPSLFDELVIDNFAGGGGASLGIEMALGRAVDIAINHDPEAVAMHMANHPNTRHYREDVWQVDPVEVCQGRPVGLAWFSPDCKHFSKAKGGKPVSRRTRGLAWVVIRWAQKVSPRVIMLENVEEFEEWGPLTAACGKDGLRKLDGAGKPVMIPCQVNKGATFYRWVSRLEKLGYRVEWRHLRACDYGAPTIRKRLFLVARRDGMPIVWPAMTHADLRSEQVQKGKLQPWRTAADCIDWSIPVPSIFERKKPLADATMRRIAKGIMRYVVDNPEPFIVTYYGDKGRKDHFRGQAMDQPLATQTTENRHALVVPLTHRGERYGSTMQAPMPTVTAAHRGELAIVAPVFTEHANASSPRCMSADEPLRTICANVKGGHHALISAFMAQHNGGFYDGAGRSIDTPLSTIVHRGTQQGLVTANMIRHFGESVGSSPEQPLGTITAGGLGKTGLVTANLIRNFGSSAGWSMNRPAGTSTGRQKDALVTSHLVKLRGTCRDGQPVMAPMPTVTASGLHVGEVRAFLLKYYGSDQDPQILEPLHTITTRDRFGLVTVRGEQYTIIDIGLRMLSPRELFRAQGFGDDYVIDPIHNGKPLTKTAQVRMCGNSVSPWPAAALVRANVRIGLKASLSTGRQQNIQSRRAT